MIKLMGNLGAASCTQVSHELAHTLPTDAYFDTKNKILYLILKTKNG